VIKRLKQISGSLKIGKMSLVFHRFSMIFHNSSIFFTDFPWFFHVFPGIFLPKILPHQAPATTVELEQVLQKRPDGRAKWLAKALVQARPRGAKRQSWWLELLWLENLEK